MLIFINERKFPEKKPFIETTKRTGNTFKKVTNGRLEGFEETCLTITLEVYGILESFRLQKINQKLLIFTINLKSIISIIPTQKKKSFSNRNWIMATIFTIIIPAAPLLNCFLPTRNGSSRSFLSFWLIYYSTAIFFYLQSDVKYNYICDGECKNDDLCFMHVHSLLFNSVCVSSYLSFLFIILSLTFTSPFVPPSPPPRRVL